MVFSSLYFTFLFLPFVVGLYYLAKEKYRNYLLLAASLFFYAYGEPSFVLVMIGSILVNFAVALLIDKAKAQQKASAARLLLWTDVLLNIGILFVFKYLDFTISIFNDFLGANLAYSGLSLPIGISFFSFQALSYVIDVYRGTVEVQKNPFYLALYISFFPQLIAGPIVRYSTIQDQILHRPVSVENFGEGTRRFLLGFAKKVILANNLSVAASEVFALQPQTANPAVLWVGSLCYSLQIFYDFSGYSDMAIGLGKLFGFEFEENFNYPYISGSVTEFWRRWHISLGQWFRDYVYIPLGGSRVSVPRHIFNLFVVWTLTGIWHGANYTFIAWGLGYFLLLVVEKYLVKPESDRPAALKILWQIFTLFCVNFGWVLFNSAGIGQGISFCFSMLGQSGVPFAVDADILRYVREYGAFMLLGVLFSTPVVPLLRSKLDKTRLAGAVSLIAPIGYGMVFLWAVSYIILGTHNPFIYFNF